MRMHSPYPFVSTSNECAPNIHMSDVETDDRLAEALLCVREAVRAEKPYLVGGPDNQSVKLNQNESPYDLPAEIKEAVAEQFLSIPVNRYPREHPWELRDKLALSLGVEPEMLLIGNGSNELTQTIGLAFVERGEPVVLPRPMFALYESVVRMHGGRVVGIPPKEDLSFDVDAIVEAIESESPALTIVTTPNNPTGLAVSYRDVERIVQASRGVVLVDEAYWEFNDEPSAAGLLGDHPNLIIIRTFSKAMGMAGMRLGYLLANPLMISELLKARLPFMIDRFSETVGLAVLDRPHLVDERVTALKESFAELVTGMEALPGVKVMPSAANFVLFQTEMEPADLLHRLADQDVLVRNMSGYPELRGYLRVNAGTPSENKAFLVALERALT
jgi:histidinol-phosphate aminotransferase